MNLAILGAGNIGNKMATTVKQMEGVTLHAVASRSLAKARSSPKRTQSQACRLLKKCSRIVISIWSMYTPLSPL